MNKERLINILSKNLDVGHYALMDIIVKEKNINDLWQSLKVRGWREALIRKGFIQEVNNEYFLTDSGKAIYKELSGIVEKEVDISELNLDNKIEEICKEIITQINWKILERTGQKRMVLKSGKVFNCSVKELQKRLTDFSNKFKNSNFDEMKRAILNYTDDILNNKIGFPRALVYFIWKDVKGDDGKMKTISDMLTYMETLTTEEKIIDKSKLFG